MWKPLENIIPTTPKALRKAAFALPKAKGRTNLKNIRRYLPGFEAQFYFHCSGELSSLIFPLYIIKNGVPRNILVLLGNPKADLNFFCPPFQNKPPPPTKDISRVNSNRWVKSTVTKRIHKGHLPHILKQLYGQISSTVPPFTPIVGSWSNLLNSSDTTFSSKFSFKPRILTTTDILWGCPATSAFLPDIPGINATIKLGFAAIDISYSEFLRNFEGLDLEALVNKFCSPKTDKNSARSLTFQSSQNRTVNKLNPRSLSISSRLVARLIRIIIRYLISI